MGKSIKKIWYGNDNNSLQLNCNTGTVAVRYILAQKGTGKYKTPSGTVKLVNKTSGLNVGEASLEHNGKTVKKITQYRIYYFDNSPSELWREGDGSLLGVFNPLPVGVAPATPPDAFTIAAETNAIRSYLYTSAPVTITGGAADMTVTTTGEYSVYNGSTWSSFTSAPGTIQPNNQIRVRGLSAPTYTGVTSYAITINGLSRSFSITVAADAIIDLSDWTVQSSTPLLDGAYFNTVRV